MNRIIGISILVLTIALNSFGWISSNGKVVRIDINPENPKTIAFLLNQGSEQIWYSIPSALTDSEKNRLLAMLIAAKSNDLSINVTHNNEYGGAIYVWGTSNIPTRGVQTITLM